MNQTAKGSVFMANRMNIIIAGQEYTMLADETPEYMNEVAEFAQQTISSCGGSAKYATTRSLALSIINLADEYIKARRATENMAAKCQALEAENDALRKKIERQNQNGKHNKKR